MAGVPQDRLQLLGFLHYHRCIAIGTWNAVNGELVKKIVSNPRSPWQGIRNAALLILIPSRGYCFLKYKVPVIYLLGFTIWVLQ